MAYTAVWWRIPGGTSNRKQYVYGKIASQAILGPKLECIYLWKNLKSDGWCGELGRSGNGSANCEQLAMIICPPFRPYTSVQRSSHFAYFHFAYSYFTY